MTTQRTSAEPSTTMLSRDNHPPSSALFTSFSIVAAHRVRLYLLVVFVFVFYCICGHQLPQHSSSLLTSPPPPTIPPIHPKPPSRFNTPPNISPSATYFESLPSPFFFHGPLERFLLVYRGCNGRRRDEMRFVRVIERGLGGMKWWRVGEYLMSIDAKLTQLHSKLTTSSSQLQLSHTFYTTHML
ncbi:hypothetical protein BZA70DRAFT_13434 [Myxozyma melibiosi]|uniref:Uncharacterized protein n=1 Tax=Myxozyma melibiosi TaxID=54550 RepID=A0ABR1FC34_9ASCO